jgi:hypothetical protein
MAVRLSALRAGRLLPFIQEDSWYSLLLEAESTGSVGWLKITDVSGIISVSIIRGAVCFPKMSVDYYQTTRHYIS